MHFSVKVDLFLDPGGSEPFKGRPRPFAVSDLLVSFPPTGLVCNMLHIQCTTIMWNVTWILGTLKSTITPWILAWNLKSSLSNGPALLLQTSSLVVEHIPFHYSSDTAELHYTQCGHCIAL